MSMNSLLFQMIAARAGTSSNPTIAEMLVTCPPFLVQS